MSLLSLGIQNGKGDKSEVIYNPLNTSMIWNDGELQIDKVLNTYSKFIPNRNLKEVRLVLGYKCNFSCKYCWQSFKQSDNPIPLQYDLNTIVEKIYTAVGTACIIQFWGGEPLLYYKDIVKLVTLFKSKGINNFGIITNGSLITKEIVDFLLDNKFIVGISHDGQGHNLRTIDPFKNEKILEQIKRLVTELKTISFNPTITKDNYNHNELLNYFDNVFNSRVMIGEGSNLMISDSISESCMIPDDELHKYQNIFYNFLNTYSYSMQPFTAYIFQIFGFLNSISYQREVLEYNYCPGSNNNILKIDLQGNTLKCHSFSHDTNLVFTSWSQRKLTDCKTCPVLFFCRGGCPYQEDGYYHVQSCKNSLYHHLALLGYTITLLTDGWVLTEINPIN